MGSIEARCNNLHATLGRNGKGDLILGLPNEVTACLFDLDGVLTDTATVHAAAWKESFDAFLRERSASTGEQFVPFDRQQDYRAYVDGKPREAGVRDFLASRGVDLPEGNPDDPPEAHTIHGLGRRKNNVLVRRIREDGVEVFEGSRRYLGAAEDAGLRRAVVSSSANTEQVLEVTGLAPFIELRVDGVTIREERLPGKPAPDTFLRAADLLGVAPDRAAVFEDAIAGVEAGRAGNFRVVVGVDRVGRAAALRDKGADIVVSDLADLLAEGDAR
jgi:beta-phosphoglucomutase family hydrolase